MFKIKILIILTVFILIISFSRPLVQALDDKYFDRFLRYSAGYFLEDDWDTEFRLPNKHLFGSSFVEILHHDSLAETVKYNHHYLVDYIKARDFKFVEIDVFLIDGTIYCGHDIREDYSACRISYLIKNSPSDTIFILDTKGDVERLILRAVETIDTAIRRERLVLQVYQPKELSFSAGFINEFKGFLYTNYKSLRRIDEVCTNLSLVGQHYIVLSTYDLPKIKYKCLDQKFLVHPINNCEQLNELEKYNNIQGAFFDGRARSCGFKS
jgi:hypothetical protein